MLEQEIPQKASYKGSEVCQYTDTQPYVLQFWASEFPQLRPRRSGGGQPVYSRRDLEVILRIKELLSKSQKPNREGNCRFVNVT